MTRCMALPGLLQRLVLCLVPLLLMSSPGRCAEGHAWSYDDDHGDGPSNWHSWYPACNDNHQSPIDIQFDKAEHKDIAGFTFSGYDSAAGYQYEIANNGHSVQVNINRGEIRISGGGLESSNYKLAQFHMHWGRDDSVGSEHTVNQKAYPLEIHLVHYNMDYNDIGAAVPNPNGLAVLGVFAEVSGSGNPAVDKIIAKFDAVKYADSKTSIDPFVLRDLLPSNTKEFVRYPGSLTTPGCFESVTWTVFKNPIQISDAQMKAFRTLFHGRRGEREVSLVDNFRPVQQVNDRVIHRTFHTSSAAQIGGFNILTVGFALAASLRLLPL